MDLLCCEATEDFECRAYADPAIVSNSRVLKNLLAAEDRYVISASYFDCFQTELKPNMRKMLTEWMLEVCEEEQCQPDVNWLAVNYLDRFLGVYRMAKSNLQLLGAVCLFLASKLKQTRPLTAEQLVQYTDRSITLDELWQWELLVLNLLKWDLSAITPHDFVDVLLSQLRLDLPACRVDVRDQRDATRRLAHGFIALCALEHKLTMYPPSMIACACVAAALRARAARQSDAAVLSDLLEQLHQLTHIETECLRSCLELIEEYLRDHMRGSAHPGQASGSQVPPNMAGGPLKLLEKSGTPTDIRDIDF